MKKLIVLSGNSERNQAWGEGAVEFFGPWFDDVYMQYYYHWGTDSGEMDIEAELQKIKAVTEVAGDGTEFYVFAKSIGSLLALISINKKIITPSKCVFFGMPIDLAAGSLFKDDWSPLFDFQIPTLAFHNIDDPVANCQFAGAKLNDLKVETIEFVKVPGDNHNYTEFSDYEAKIKEFLSL